ncbi:MAG: hypothetical protein EOO88_15565 [Pedobacter sp.]|nr:MAG: hypothetical protein EOO88_15565 [Pedobacter sp.]
MTKRFYNLINLLLAIVIFAGLIQTALRFVLGASLFLQGSFLTFFLVEFGVALFMTAFVMKYYWSKQYKLTFFAAGLWVIISVIHASIIYLTLSNFQQHPLYLTTLQIQVAVSVVYGLCLIFSNAGNRFWLRIAGIYLIILNVPTILSVIWLLQDQSVHTSAAIEGFAPWVSLFASLAPVFLMLNFRDEIKQLEEDSKTQAAKSFSEQWYAVAIIMGLAVFAIGFKLAQDAYLSRHWAEQNFKQTKELADKFEARIFVGSKGDTLYYRLLKPLNYDTTKKYPLLVSLPYGGQPGTDKIRQLEGAAAAELLSSKENREKYPAFIFVPNCPAGSGWGGIPGYPSVDSLVFEAITSLNSEQGLDVKRRYVTGISRGGYGAWNFISKRPDLFAAAIPVCGGGDPAFAARAVDVAVWAFHGEHDKNVPVSGSRQMIKAIEKAGGHPKYTEFANEGHNIWYQVSITSGLWEWLFAQHQD